MKKIFFIMGLSLLSIHTCNSSGTIIQNIDFPYSQILSSLITDLPEKYRSLEYLKIYTLFQASPLRERSGAILQFYKNCVCNQNYLKRWPKEIVLQVFDYCLNDPFFLINFKNLGQSIDQLKIKSDNPIHTIEYLGHCGSRYPVVLQEKETSECLIEINNRECDFFIVRTVRKDKLPCIYLENREFDNRPNSVKNLVKIYHKSNDEEISDKDEEISDQEFFSEFKFDDYIIQAFCCGEFLIVELIDEVIEQVSCYKNSGVTKTVSHRKDCLPPRNHRTEIYNVYTKKKFSTINIPLCEPYQFNSFMYSLFYMDFEKIYLYNHKNNIYVALPYKNCSIIDAIKDDSDFFVAHLMPKVLKRYSKYSASSNITKNHIQKRINYPVPLYMLRLFLPFFYYFYYERTDYC